MLRVEGPADGQGEEREFYLRLDHRSCEFTVGRRSYTEPFCGSKVEAIPFEGFAVKEIIRGQICLTPGLVNGNAVRLMALGRVMLMRTGAGEGEIERFVKRGDALSDDYRELLGFVLDALGNDVQAHDVPEEYRDVLESHGVEFV